MGVIGTTAAAAAAATVEVVVVVVVVVVGRGTMIDAVKGEEGLVKGIKGRSNCNLEDLEGSEEQRN